MLIIRVLVDVYKSRHGGKKQKFALNSLNPTHVFNRIIHMKNMNIAYESRLHMKIRTLHIKINHL
jgi:hypothetical protein